MLAFANPLALSLLLVAPILIYAYRKRKSEKSQTVSSLMILKTLSRKIVPRKRIKLPLRFYFELFALLTIAIASAMPSTKTKKIAVLFDNSLSMAAKDSNKKSRLDLALEKFETAKNIKDSYLIFSSSPNLKITNSSVKISQTPDRLISAISELTSDSDYDKIWVYTDKKLKSENSKLISFQIGTPINNAYFESANLSPEHKIKVKINSSIKGKAELILYALDFSGKVTKKISQETIKLTPSSEFFLQGDSENLAYRIELKVEDALAEDNVAWLVASDELSSKILLVTQLEQASGLESISGLKVEKINQEQYLKLENLEKYSLAIFHRSAPAFLPSIPVLLILPPSENSLFPIINESKIQLSSWNENHPISSYLRANLISPTKGVEFKTPSWAESIISGEKGSIVAAGQRNAILVAASGIELLPYEGRKTPALSILTVNLIKWLNNKSKLGAINLTGENYTLKQNSTIILPNQEVLNIDQSKELNLNWPGIYLISKQGALAVNTFHPKESNTNLIEELTIPKVENQKPKQHSKWWKYLTTTAIGFLILEMLIRVFQRER